MHIYTHAHSDMQVEGLDTHAVTETSQTRQKSALRQRKRDRQYRLIVF